MTGYAASSAMVLLLMATIFGACAIEYFVQGGVLDGFALLLCAGTCLMPFLLALVDKLKAQRSVSGDETC